MAIYFLSVYFRDIASTTFAYRRVKLSQGGLVERSLYPNLKLTMYRSGIRQNRLARTIGMNEASLSRIMNGTREPGLEVQQHIASVLQENAEWLFQRTVSQQTRVLVSSVVGTDEVD